jgi:hypothetical protein
MATPVADLLMRLRHAAVSGERADAVSGAFEALSNQIADLANHVRSLIIGQWIQMGLLLVVAAAILAPYIGAWADLAR